MNNCKACGGTGLQWMGDFSIGTEHQDTCVICKGQLSSSSWKASDIVKTERVKLTDWEITEIIWNTRYPDRRRFKKLERQTQVEWVEIVVMALGLDHLNRSNPDLLWRLKKNQLD